MCKKKFVAEKGLLGREEKWGNPPPPFRILDNQPTRQCPNISSLFTAPHLKRFPGVEKFIETFFIYLSIVNYLPLTNELSVQLLKKNICFFEEMGEGKVDGYDLCLSKYLYR